jgi:hypothetical protein
MSWDISLLCNCCGHQIVDENYTHNTSKMIYTVLREKGYELGDNESWWARLNGMSGPEGAAFLHLIIKGLEADPVRFRAMNPDNGWGDYDRLVGILSKMMLSVPEFSTTWSGYG